MQIISSIFLLVFFAAFAGVIKPYIGNLTRWQFAVAAFLSAMICGATAPKPDPDPTPLAAKKEVAEAKEVARKPSQEKAEEKPTKQVPPVQRDEAKAPPKGKRSAGPDQATQMRIVVASQDGVRSRLKDPDSADFRNVGYYSGGKEGASAVCGEVNAKNSFGAFSGFERFVAMGPEVAFLESDVEASEFAKVWQGVCVKADTDEVQLP